MSKTKSHKNSKPQIEVIQKNSEPEKPKQIWFKAKEYGYGWYPATWQGWATIAAYLIFNFSNYFLIKSQTNSESDLLVNFVFDMLLSTFLLVLVAMSKGEKASWRWGKKD
ncbi:MAG: hypothetical protein WCK98_01835 [bacterium]